jgi:HD-GYP domain-containing protein (c-di-GMP phosphodiesterase class II)
MTKLTYQQGDLSLANTNYLPLSVRKGQSAAILALSTDIDGRTYTVESASSGAAGGQPDPQPTLYCLGEACYIETKAPALFKFAGHADILLEPGIYKVSKKSQYIHVEHGRDVAKYALPIARALNFDSQHLLELEFAAKVHDIGLKGMEATLWKPQWFSADDWQTVQEHPARGAEIIEKLKGRIPLATERVKQYILHHHEHFDGSGYATGLAGEDIPIGSRILLIADAFHAMTSWRPFRQPLPEHTALDRLWGDAGYRYDRNLLEVFSEALEDEAINALAG